MNASCQCSKPMTNAADFCARCGRPVQHATGNPPSLLLCKPDEVEIVRGLATMEAHRVHVDEVGRVWLPPVNSTPPDLSISIGSAEAVTEPPLTSGTLSRRSEHSDIVVTAGHRQSSFQTVDVIAILEAMPSLERHAALDKITRRFGMDYSAQHLISMQEQALESLRQIQASLHLGSVRI